MIRFKGALTLSLVSGLALLGSVGVSEARDIKVKRIAPALAASQVAAPASAAAVGKPVETRAVEIPAVSVPACARKVKVIYAGYGEADRATCTISATNSASTVVATR